MLSKFPFKQQARQFLVATAPREQYRLGIFWSVIILAVLILGFTGYHIQAIPEKIMAGIHGALDNRRWVRELVVADGRYVYLRGEVEPDSGLENEIAGIADVPGVARVRNVLDELPKPSPHLNLEKSGQQLVVSGRLRGEFLAPVISRVAASFPGQRIVDRLKIDDRLGRPLWLEGFDQSLSHLSALDDFTLNGWRDQIEITGSVDDDLQRRRIGYAVPASLISQVKVINRLKQKVAENFPAITLISDWRGLSIEGVVPSAEIRDQLVTAALHAFGVEPVDSMLQVQDNLSGAGQLRLLSALLPSLGQVRDLRLESTGKGFVVWGRVDDPFQLGDFLATRNALGLAQTVRNEIFIARADKSAAVTLFSDQSRAIVSGVLPTMKSKQQLVADIKDSLGVHDVVDLVSIEPNIAHGDWLIKWPELLANLPQTVIGISIDDNSLLVTGHTQSADQLAQIDRRLDKLLPNQNRLNWMTASKIINNSP